MTSDNGMDDMPTTIQDPMDRAYFWFGVRALIATIGGVDPDTWQGEIGFVNACSRYVSLLELQEPDGGFGGVFAYEVAEPFGFFVAKELAKGHSLNQRLAQAEVSRLMGAI